MPRCPSCRVEMTRVGRDSPFWAPLPEGMELYVCPSCLNIYVCVGEDCEEYTPELYKAIIETLERKLAEPRRKPEEPKSEAVATSPPTPAVPVESHQQHPEGAGGEEPTWKRLPVDLLERYARRWAEKQVRMCPVCNVRMVVWYVRVFRALGKFQVYFYCPKCYLGRKEDHPLDLIAP